ncbi:MAG: 3-isopropylmalate dehydrogenase [Ignavibacteriaceae bacterium]|nr:3-isopropylmalate dehydrogenase [Ignavibacteriaceae bacterium]
MSYNIAVVSGDGIGPEVCSSAIKVLDLISKKLNVKFIYKHYAIGGNSYDKFGTPLTDETLNGCLEADAVLLGAVGGYKWETLPHHLKPEAALLKLRESLGLFANIRPAKVYKSMLNSSSLKKEVLEGTDFIVLRELTGGIYFGKPRGMDKSKGWNTMIYNDYEVERIARKAFEMASKRKQVVTSVDKANVLEVSQFWREIVTKVHQDYPAVKLNHMYVDNAAMQIVKNPKQFDIILTSNLFGDILSDIAGMITGSLGMLPSASIGSKHALYEPVHGSAPDIAGKGLANPIAAISSIAMMLDLSFGMTKAAEIIEHAIEKTLNTGIRTVDIAGSNEQAASTDQITELILKNVEEIFNEQAIGIFLL